MPLVAGLFVLVEGLDHTGVLKLLSQRIAQMAATSPISSAWGAAMAVAFGSNLINNLSAGLIAGSAAAAANVSPMIHGAVVIGIDLGPNLSITGSLVTILWLIALRREGESVSDLQFLKVGAIAMLTALVAALAGYAFFQ